MKKEMATLTRRGLELVRGKCVATTQEVQVRVMARAEGYAMVRCHGAIPFVASVKDLSPPREKGAP